MATFTRNSTAFRQDGTLVNTNLPRFAPTRIPGPRWRDTFDIDQLATHYTSGGDVPATWGVDAGVLTGVAGDDATLLCTGLTVADGEIVASFDQAYNSGIIARHTNNNNYYGLIVVDNRHGSRHLLLFRRVAGVFSTLFSMSINWTQGTLAQIRFRFNGSLLEAWFNDARIIVATDTSHTTGNVGMYHFDSTPTRFLDFAVHQITPSIQLEEGATNLLTANQASVETDLTGFTTNNAATLSLDSVNPLHGNASLRVVTSGLSIQEGFVTTPLTVVAASQTYTYSIWVRGSGSFFIWFQELTAAGAVVGTTFSSVLNATPVWTRHTVTRAFGTTGERTHVLFTTDNSLQATTFWVDCLQLEQKPYATSWQLPGTPRAAEVLTVPTAGVFNRGDWTVEGVYTPQIPMNVGNVGKVLLDCFIDVSNYWWFWVNANGAWVINVMSSNVNRTIQSTNNAVLQGTAYQWMIAGDGTNMRLCVNGAQIGTDTTYTEPVGTMPTNLFVGSFSTGAFQVNGFIDDIRISSRARTLAEHQATFNSGQPLTVDADTTALWQFNNNLNTIRHHAGTTAVSAVLSSVRSQSFAYAGNAVVLTRLVSAWVSSKFQPQFFVYELAENFVVKDDCPMGKVFTVGSTRPVGVEVIPREAGLHFRIENASFAYMWGGYTRASGTATTGLRNVFSYLPFNQIAPVGLVRFTFDVVVLTSAGVPDPGFQTETFVTDVEVRVV